MEDNKGIASGLEKKLISHIVNQLNFKFGC